MGRREELHQRIAVHELSHGLVWKRLGLEVVSVTFAGQNSECHVRVYDEQWREYAIGLWAGYEAEALHLGAPRRGNSAHDISEFRKATKGQRFSESQARSEARKILRPRLADIRRLAPDLIRTGHLPGGRI